MKRYMLIDFRVIDTTKWTIEKLDDETFGCSTIPPANTGILKTWFNFKKSDIQKESDNIEDLFDEFVMTDSPTTHLIGFNDKDYIDCSDGIAKLYGAIWTDTGLIYVAEYKDGEWVIL